MTHAVRRWAQSTAQLGAASALVYDGGSPPPGPSGVRWAAVPHRGPQFARAPRQFSTALEGADVLVLHSGWTLGNLYAGAVARSRRVPYVLEPRGAYDPHIVRRNRLLKRAWWAAGEGRLVHRAEAIHVFFDEDRSHLEALGYRGPIIVVPNGVDAPEDPLWRGGSGELLWLGRFDPEHKGLDLLVESVASMPAAERPRISLRGPDWRGGRKHITKLVRRARLDRWICVGPPVYGQEKRDLLTSCEGFLYPSRWDACPNAVLEAAALGVPTLCGPYPLGTHLAKVKGAIRTESDPESIAQGLHRLKDPRAMSAMGAAGARLMREEFAWIDVAERWLLQVGHVLDHG